MNQYERPIVDNGSAIGLSFYQLCINQFLLIECVKLFSVN